MITRRSFLQRTALSTAALSLRARLRAAAEGANGDIRIAVIGLNGRGGDHLDNYSRLPGVRIAAVCDVDSAVLARSLAVLKKKGIEAQGYTDLRKLFESRDVDAVSIATPNHWHSLAAIWALQAGKDVYVEKPVSHNVWEGRQLVKAAAASGRIVQMGVQSRSAWGIAGALRWVQAGNLGALQYARGLCYKRRPSIGKTEGEQPIPETVDYDLWCGPAAKEPLRRQKLHYDWHWVWNTGNGDLGNQGIHQMDIARRFTGETALSPRVFSVGGRLGYVDDGETPNSLFVIHDYEKAPLIFEVRGLPERKDAREMDQYRGASVGVVVQYEGGHLLIPSSYTEVIALDRDGKVIRKFTLTPADQEKLGGEEAAKVAENHYHNFLQAVRSRKSEELNGRILDGHLSSALCHTGNISWRLGQKKPPGELREAMQASAEARDSLDRLFEHLAANEIDLNTDQLTLGAFLKMDPQTEMFLDHPEANQLLTRDYRAPFTVPAQA